MDNTTAREYAYVILSLVRPDRKDERFMQKGRIARISNATVLTMTVLFALIIVLTVIKTVQASSKR